MYFLLMTVINFNRFGLPHYDVGETYTENTILSWLGIWSFVFAVVAILITIAFVFLIDKRYKWFERIVNRNLTVVFIFVWLFGFVTYDVGMYTGEPWSLLGNVPMAIVHAFGMFIMDSDVSAIHEHFHNNAWFMAAFSSAHFLAALVSLVFVLKHFGFNIISAFRRWLLRGSKDNTYIFWGMNDATYYLAKDIKRTYEEKEDSNYRIVVVRTNNDTNIAPAKNGMERLFNFLSLKNKDLDRLKELDCITTNTYSDISTIEIANNGDLLSASILREELRLNSLCRIIDKTDGTVHVFFLSDNEDSNILGVANLRKDCEIQSFAKRGKVKFYCHARYNSIHRVIEDEMASEKIEVKVVDSSHLCVELMKNSPILHPVNYVKVEEDATVSSPFNALVIGFGEVGLDVVRFLYEFGAFVKNGIEEVERSDFYCHVVDLKMDELAGLFTVNTPSINVSIDRPESDFTKKQINLYKLDCHSIEFYERLQKWINTLNYVVVATGDDETNITLAVRILRLAIRNREDNLSQLRILVRAQHDDNGHIQNIAWHYNRLFAAEIEGLREENKMHQGVISHNDKVNEPITLFGSSRLVYSFDQVVNDSLREDAKKFKMKYDLSVNELRIKAGEDPYPIESWDDEQNGLMQLTGKYKNYSPTYSAIMKLRRIQSQNMANSLHKATKEILAKQALGKEFDHVLVHGVSRSAGTRTYSWRDHSNLPLEHIQRVFDVLAQTEHLRWNASHEILGYKDQGDERCKDEARLKHGCLKKWKELSEKMQSNDYDVVDVSLGLIDINSSVF